VESMVFKRKMIMEAKAARAEKNADVALVYCVDQSLARTLQDQGIHTRKELLASFDDGCNFK
jgi:hypothetical protein